MARILITAALLITAAPVRAADPLPDYLDDRSSAPQVIASLYNALNRQEYLRGWSYFKPDTAPDYQTFRDGYTTTSDIRLKIGKARSEGAAGSVHSVVPVAIGATDDQGKTTVFAGCYLLTQAQPQLQDTPPFRPIQIDRGNLSESDQDFQDAMGRCDP